MLTHRELQVRLFDLMPRSVEDENLAVSEIDTKGFVTAMAVSDDGKTVVAGLFEGKCMLFEFAAERRRLDNHKTMMSIKSSRGRNAKGHKITGLQYVGGSKKSDPEAKLLVTTLDSRIRLYRVTTMSLVCKYKGHVNEGAVIDGKDSVSTQIRAVLSPDLNFVASGSEDGEFSPIPPTLIYVYKCVCIYACMYIYTNAHSPIAFHLTRKPSTLYTPAMPCQYLKPGHEDCS